MKAEELFKVELVIKNARIITVNQDQPHASAVAVKFGRIIAVGTDEELSPYEAHAKEVLDLEGKCLLPGFIDCHTHLAWTGVGFSLVQLGETKSIEETLQKISERVKGLKPGEWVVGRDWDDSKWEERRYLTRTELDLVAPENPAYIIRVCGHLASVNSLALQELELDLTQQGVEKDAEGNPTGVLKDIEVDRERWLPPVEELKEILKAACTYANSLGLTTVHDYIIPGFIEPYVVLRKTDELTVRIVMCPRRTMMDSFQNLKLSTGFGDEFLQLGSLKIFFDGAIGAQTGAMTFSYTDNPTTDGVLMDTPKKFHQAVRRALELGFQTANHAVGDRAIDLILEIFEELASEYPLEAARHRIEHASYLRDDQLEKVKELGLVLSEQPNFLKWAHPGGLYETRLGPSRYQQTHNFKKIIEIGAFLCFGSDGMPMGPLYGIWEAVNHPNPDSRISVEEALYYYTLGAAKASFEEDLKGSVEEGKFADFVVLAEDPLTVPKQTLKDLSVEMTIVGGRIVFQKDLTPS